LDAYEQLADNFANDNGTFAPSVDLPASEQAKLRLHYSRVQVTYNRLYREIAAQSQPVPLTMPSESATESATDDPNTAQYVDVFPDAEASSFNPLAAQEVRYASFDC
jgi:hypothetical protein